jgi:oligopeptide transport system substrate-binding protein
MLPARFACLLGLAVTLLLGCQQPDPGTNQPTRTYRHALDGAPASLDPAHADNVYAATLVNNLYDTLYRYKYLARPWALTPNLAADMPEVSDDGRVYTIRLRSDARFADDPAFPDGIGRAVEADDVIYSLERHFRSETRSRGAWLWEDRIKSMTAEDTHTLRFELSEPYPQFTHTLAMALSAVVPHEAVAHYGREFGIHPVGSGPFRLTRFDETMAVLVPSESYRQNPVDLASEGFDPARHAGYGLEAIEGKSPPFIDRLEIHFITEPTARWSSFASNGGVDTVMVPPELADRVLADREPLRFEDEITTRYHTLAEPEAGFVFYGFNMANPEIGHHPDSQHADRNRALRCAMRDAFDWDQRKRSFYHGLGQTFPGVIPPMLAAYDPESSHDSLTHDPQQARRRLAEQGWQPESLPSLVYGLESSVHQRQMFEQFRAWMQAIGFPADRLSSRSFASFGEYFRAIGQRELDLFLLGWTLAYPDAQYSLQLFYGPNAAPGANSFNYANDEYDRLFDQAAILPAGPERTRLYRQLNDMVIDDCVLIGSLARTRLHLWKRQVVMWPDREMGGGGFLRFVTLQDKAQ